MSRSSVKKIIFILLILLIGVYRSFLIGKGAYSFPDESRYLNSIEALSYLTNGDIKNFGFSISTTSGRPGDALVRCIPAFGQRLVEKFFKLGPNNPRSLLVPTFFNVIVSLIILILFFKSVLLIFNQNFSISLVCTFIYSLLVNSNIYIRHILPYDIGLLFFILIIYIFIKKKNNNELINIKTIIFLGFLAGYSFTIYPGYYFIPIFTVIVLLLSAKTEFYLNRKFALILVFALTSVCILMLFESMALFTGVTYLGSLSHLAGTVTQGTFEEGYTFFPKYLISVEDLIGYLILTANLIFVLKLVFEIKKRKVDYFFREKAKTMILIVFALILLHGSLSVIFHKMVFYGRLIHLFYPFVIVALFYVVYEIRSQFVKVSLLSIIVLASLYSFFMFTADYMKIAYPRDVLFSNRIIINNYYSDHFINESPFGAKISTPADFYNNSMFNPVYSECDVDLINFCYYYPVSEKFQEFMPDTNQNIIFEEKHFLSYRAYGFEGFNERERELLKERNYMVKIYSYEK